MSNHGPIMPVIMNGVRYRSCREAMIAIGLTKSERGRLRPLLRVRGRLRIGDHLLVKTHPDGIEPRERTKP
jgi:hypothetical protein